MKDYCIFFCQELDIVVDVLIKRQMVELLKAFSEKKISWSCRVNFKNSFIILYNSEKDATCSTV